MHRGPAAAEQYGEGLGGQGDPQVEGAGPTRSGCASRGSCTTRSPHGLDHISNLVKGFQTTGLEATLTIEGHPHAVPAAVSRTAYRIVQESLTNVARHAAATTASVVIDYRLDALAILVDDNGKATPHPAPTPGLGLLGMRERVTALGGRLRTGPRSAGGFTVQAELPTNGAS